MLVAKQKRKGVIMAVTITAIVSILLTMVSCVIGVFSYTNKLAKDNKTDGMLLGTITAQQTAIQKTVDRIEAKVDDNAKSNEEKINDNSKELSDHKVRLDNHDRELKEIKQKINA